jgi:hypothetical protein
MTKKEFNTWNPPRSTKPLTETCYATIAFHWQAFTGHSRYYIHGKGPSCPSSTTLNEREATHLSYGHAEDIARLGCTIADEHGNRRDIPPHFIHVTFHGIEG